MILLSAGERFVSCRCDAGAPRALLLTNRIVFHSYREGTGRTRRDYTTCRS